MERLIRFIYEYRALFTFFLLEILCAWLIIRNNQFQSTTFFNSSNRVAANILGVSRGIGEYISLRDINQDLAEENAQLRSMLEKRNQQLIETKVPVLLDSSIAKRFEFISARVVSNSTEFYKNYITIDKGKNDGIEAGMAVISSHGAVGKVKSCSNHFSVLISLLNTDEMVSCIDKRTENFGTIQWDGLDPRYTSLRYIPRHATPIVGDTIITSGYNAVFPKGIFVGVITSSELSEEAPFWEIKVELAQDFNKLAFVEIVKSNLKLEKDSLEAETFSDIR